MASVSALLRRTQKLEQRLRPPKSPIEIAYGSFGVFEERCKAKVASGQLDPIDVPIVLNALRTWFTVRN